jgi:aarF domain-containing kinase
MNYETFRILTSVHSYFLPMSIRNRLPRFFKFSGYSIGIGAIYVLYDLNANEWDIVHYGPIRAGRAGWAAAQVAFDYKLTFRRHRELSADSLKWLNVKSEIHRRSADRLLRMCCSNGGAYIKVGQHIGALDDLLPSEYVQTFKVLHSRAPQSAVSDLLRVVRKDLGQDPNKVFKCFDPEPLGTASLAQVHKAELFDGRTVAVKIQHPRVKERSATDIWMMALLCRCVTYVFPDFEFLWLAEETKKNLPLELDFLHEGRNTDKLRNLLDLHFLKGKFHDQENSKWIVIRRSLGGHNDMPCVRPAPDRPIGRPRSGGPQGIMGGFSYY